MFYRPVQDGSDPEKVVTNDAGKWEYVIADDQPPGWLAAPIPEAEKTKRATVKLKDAADDGNGN